MRIPLVVVAFLALVSAGLAQIRVVGSDVFSPDLTQAVETFAQRNKVKVALKLQGSLLGLDTLKNKQAELGLFVFRPGDPLPADFQCEPFAYQAALVLVAPNLPLSQITYAQLTGIFTASEGVGFRRWGDLGLVGEWASRSITPRALASNTSLALDLFRYSVPRAPALRANVAIYSNLTELAARVSTDDGSIVIAPLIPKSIKDWRPLSVTKDKNDPAAAPTLENISSGAYPLRLPVYLVFRKSDAPRLLPLFHFLLSDAIIPVLDKSFLVPLPLEARNQLILNLEGL